MALSRVRKTLIIGNRARGFIFRGAAGDQAVSTSRTYPINIGAASSDRLVIVGVGAQNGGVTSVTVNGVTLTQDVTDGGTVASYVFSGLVTSGSGVQNVVVNGVSIFVSVGITVYTGNGLSSNVVKHTATIVGGASSTTINVSAGDFMISQMIGIASNTGSTQAPSIAGRVDFSGAPNVGSDEWNTIGATNASFTVAYSSPPSGASIATYR